MRYADGGGLTAAGRQRREAVRLQAAELFEQKIKPPEVARRLRVSRKSAYQWHQLWRDGGREALASRGPSGSRCRLSPRCLEKLAGYLEQGPAAHGWVEDQVWTAARVATLIGRKFHVSYSVSGATRLMHRLGFSPQVPAAGRRTRRAGRHRVEGGDLGGGKRARAASGGYICFEDEAGFTRRPPRGRTWGRRGVTPQVTVSGRRSGRLSVAGLIAMRPGSRTRLCHRLRTHPSGKGKRRSMGERDFIALIDGVHQLVKAPIVLVWDRLNTHVSHAMRELIAEREWLSVFLLPAYSPDLNPVEWVWAHVKRSLANLAVLALDRLEALVRNRLKRLQYRPDTLHGFIAGTGLTLDDPTSP
ncbi:IS630 family transposase [Streptomyces peucetius]|uniref:IS630 family transposase n=1 Tax=Streptomyces peucetius TaxID=1950 RepID=A0ABY6IEB3_STRPE|nr:IS630 family transposase [Streptomyces peucetius]UYQ65356.1 IS630 family transposase [Streptomyces peucetius]